LDPERFVMVSNFIGYLLDHAAAKGFARVLLVGHLGKIVKVAAGVFHTHTRYGDARLETLAAYAVLEGASREVILDIFGCVTTSAVVDIIDREKIHGVYEKIAAAIKRRCEERTNGAVAVEVIVFTDNQRLLAQTSLASQFIAELKRDNSQGKVI
ncbi:MAG: cobalt-precorrin-5B (C(1))-methyltransferase, partial [Bacillota bacterium]|nr:cobalt-precorrin-5B (C(1))-methyltransferase [Bacillota bacterium]